MNAKTGLLALPIDASSWERAMYAFLAEKEARSGSIRTVQSYSRMLRHFFGTAGRTPDRISSAEVRAWAHGVGLSGKQPSATTIGARTACLSSFYRFAMGMLAANPCDALNGQRFPRLRHAAIQPTMSVPSWPSFSTL